MTGTPEQIELTARVASEYYMRLRQLATPYYRITPEDEAAWLHFAALLLEHRIDPALYVKWAVGHWRSLGRPIVYVKQIANAKTLQWYLDDREEIEKEIALRVRLQHEVLLHLRARGIPAEEIVTDALLDLTPIFRYAEARRAGLLGLADRLRADAELEAASHPAYRAFLDHYE